MSYSRKYLNNTSSPVSVTITSSTEPAGFLGSVSIAAYSALYTSNDIEELDILSGFRTLDKYVDGVKVYFSGPTGYLASLGYTGSVGYTGSRGYTGSVGA